ncbi:MAG: MATE family efflux transporter, partial [Agathobacter sp.]|nr:MATE family efflux transporter [Agathobacter sp.]
DFIRLSFPSLINSLVWSVAFSMYTAIMGHLSSDVVAANSIVSVVRNFGAVFCYAVAGSSGIYIGKSIGAGKMEEAKANSKRAMVLMFATGLVGGFLIFLSIPFVLQVASLSETAMKYLKIMLYINCVYIMGSAVNSTMITGIFRAGGDSKFGMICDFIDMWLYAVPLGVISAFVLKLPPMIVYVLLCTDEFVKWPWVFKHYRSGKWMKNITRDFD